MRGQAGQPAEPGIEPDRVVLERRRVHREGGVFEDGEVRPLSGLDGPDLGVELQGERRPEGDRVQHRSWLRGISDFIHATPSPTGRAAAKKAGTMRSGKSSFAVAAT